MTGNKRDRYPIRYRAPLQLFAAFFWLVTAAVADIYPQHANIAEPDDNTLVIEDSPEMNVIAFGKTVIIKGSANEVFSWGGDVIVKGRIDGDVAALGGSVIQKEGAYIGGAVIVIGGSYKPESAKSSRGDGAETVVFAMFEEEFRNLAQDPTQIFAPTLSAAFLVQRVLSALFWFLVSFVVATLAPGAVSRSIAEVKTKPLRTVGYGSAGLLISLVLVIVGLKLLPDYLGAVASLMSILLLFLAYGFGRVVLQVLLGRWEVRKVMGRSAASDAIAVFAGTLTLTVVLSLPYVWPFAVFALFAVGIGLVMSVVRRGRNTTVKSA